MYNPLLTLNQRKSIMGINSRRTAPASAAQDTTLNVEQAPGVGASQPLRAMSLAEVASSKVVPSRLSQQARAYLEDVTDKMKSFNIGNIRRMSMSTTAYDAVIFANEDDKGVLLIFDDNFTSFQEPGQQRSCPIDRVTDIDQQFRNLCSGRNTEPDLIDPIVVTRGMYDRSWQMANHICGCLSDEPMMTVDDILRPPQGSRQTPRLLCSTNLNEVREMFAMYSPHDVMARCDCGFMLSLQTEPAGFNSQSQPPMPILAVAGYTTFYSNLAGMSNFTGNGNDPERNKINAPCFVVTDVVSILPRAYLMPLINAAGMQTMIFNENWVSPFTRFGDNMLNLGYLPNTATPDEPTPCTSIDDVKNFVQYYVKTPPYMALDITYGRAKLPGLDAWSDPSGRAQLNDITAFFANHVTDQDIQFFANSKAVDHTFYEYIGTAEVGQAAMQSVDSRTIDYLYLANRGVPVGQLRKFLYPSENPWDRINAMGGEALGIQVKPLYYNVRVIFDGAYLVKLNSLLQSAKISIVYDNEQKIGLSNAATALFQSNANNYSQWTPLSQQRPGFGNNPLNRFFEARF